MTSNRILLLPAVAPALSVRAQFPCQPFADYPLNGNGADASGNGFDGEVYGATATEDRFGFPGMAMHFDGVNDRIILPSDFDEPQRTWAFWFKADNITEAFTEIYDVDHPGIQNAQTEVFFVEEDGVDKLKMNMGSSNTVHALPVNEGEWYHLAQVRSAEDVRFYVNGCLVFTSTDISNVHSVQGQPTACLGTGRHHNNYWFNGDLDGLKVFDCALNALDIALLASVECGSVGSSTCALVAHYPLDGDAADMSWNGFGGTVSGCVPTADRNGVPDAALLFDGIDDAVDLPVDFDVPVRTWAFWCRADVIEEAIHEVFDADHGSIEHAQTELFFVEEDGQKKVKMNMGSANTLYEQAVAEGQWYHYALVRSALDVRFYVNGCLVFTSTDLDNVHSAQGVATVRLGTGRFHDDYWFAGALDDVHVYACALDEDRIEQMGGGCSTGLENTPTPAGLAVLSLGADRFRVIPPTNAPWMLDVVDPLGRCVATRAIGTGEVVLSGHAAGVYQFVARSGTERLVTRVLVGKQGE